MKVTHQRVISNPTTPELGRLYYLQTEGGYRLKVTSNSGSLTDMDAPTLAQHALKEDKITVGTSLQYWRGDKTWATLDKASIGLDNVDNTSDTDKPISTATQNALNLKIDSTEKGAINGVATLDANGLIPTGQLPSFVDDVLEGTYISAVAFNDPNGDPYTPESGKIYIDTATTPNRQYRWSGSAYVKISSGDVTEMANFFVRYDTSQSLSVSNKTTARSNIGATSLSETDSRYLRNDATSAIRLNLHSAPAAFVDYQPTDWDSATNPHRFYINRYDTTRVGIGVIGKSTGYTESVLELDASLIKAQYGGFETIRDYTTTADNRGLNLFGGGKVYKKSGTGIVIRMSSGNVNPQIETNDGSTQYTIYHSGNLSLSGYLTQATADTRYTPLSHVGSGGTSHAIATTTVAGFMSAADKTKLDSYSTTDAHWVETSAW